MVQLGIGYVAIGVGILLLLAGVFAVLNRMSPGLLTDSQRAIMVGGVCGMLGFFAALLVFW